MTHVMHSWAGTENNPGRTGHTEMVSAASPGTILVRVENSEEDATEFYFTADWAVPYFSLRDYSTYSDEENSGSLSPGSYDIEAIVPAPGGNWIYVSSADTGESGDEVITINLDASETVTVTYTATYSPP